MHLSLTFLLFCFPQDSLLIALCVCFARLLHYWDWVEFGTRYCAPAELVDSNHEFSDEFIKLTANAAQGKGGTAFGDSGGPNLLGGTDTILAVTSWGTNYQCADVSYAQRVDTPDVLDWIHSFLE